MVEYTSPYSDEQQRVLINIEQHYDTWMAAERAATELLQPFYEAWKVNYIEPPTPRWR